MFEIHIDPVYLHELKMLLLHLLCNKYRNESCFCVFIFIFGTTSKPTYTNLVNVLSKTDCLQSESVSSRVLCTVLTYNILEGKTWYINPCSTWSYTDCTHIYMTMSLYQAPTYSTSARSQIWAIHPLRDITDTLETLSCSGHVQELFH
jgi:hypothetical protein